MSNLIAGSPSRIFLSSLLFVLALYLISTAIAVITAQNSIDFTAILPDIADYSIQQVDLKTGAIITGVDPQYQVRTIFGYLWYEIFSLVEFIIVWVGAGFIIIIGGLSDLLLKIFFEPVVNGIGILGSAILGWLPYAEQVFSDLEGYKYAGISFNNSVNFFLETIPSWFVYIKYAGEVAGIFVVEVTS